MRQFAGRRCRSVCLVRIVLCAAAVPWMISAGVVSSWAAPPNASGAPQPASNADTPATILAEAIAAARQIEGAESKAFALYEIAQAQAELRMIDQAETTANEAMTAARQIGGAGAKAKMKCQIAAVQARVGQAEQARSICAEGVAVASKVADVWEKASLLRHIAESQMKAGLFADAIATARRIDDWTGDKTRLLFRIAGAQAKAGQPDQARRAFDEAMTSADKIATVSLADICRACGARVFADLGRYAEAFAAAHAMKDSGYRATVLCDIAAAQVDAGQKELAWRTIEEAAAVDVRNSRSKVLVLCQIADVQVKTGQLEQAKTNLAKAHSIVVLDIGRTRATPQVLREVAVMDAKAGLKDQARQSFAEAIAEVRDLFDPKLANVQRSVIEQIAGDQAKAGFFAESLAVARGLDYNESLLCDIAVAQAKAGLTGAARETFAEAMAATQNHKNMSLKAAFLQLLAQRKADAGFFAEALGLARKIENIEHRSWVLRNIALELAKAERTRP